MRSNFYSNRVRRDTFKVLLKQFSNLVMILIWNQSHTNFGESLTSDNRFGTFTSITTPNSVYVKRRTDRVTLVCRISFFTINILDVDRFLIIFKIKRRFCHFSTLLSRKLFYIIVETRNRNMIIFIVQRRNHFR